ncbi:MAG: HAMP domain-containing sensor histidine kinase [Thermodesulfobacteriota bacterium]|nr:MAG: HAMP domain-containing sensor histidine kinase [Thermodesulfobacteriota bacterium]
MNKRIFSDSRALELSHQLEILILTEHHEDVLWRETHDLRHYQLRNSKLQEAERLICELHNNATFAKKRKLIGNIQREFERFKVATMPEKPFTLEETTLLPDNLLQALENFGEQNHKQMKDTIRASNRLDKLVDRWSQIFISFVTIVVVLGPLVLIKRIVRPTVTLMRTAKIFGRGNFHVRITDYRNDEFGMLCKTFNDMAEAICDLEKDRRNFIAAVAHDLKNPLTMIGASAYRLRKKISASGENLIWLNHIIERTGYLENLVHDLMDSVQIETGNLSLHLEQVDLTSLVRNVHQMQSKIITTHRIVFEGNQECRIKGDARRLERVILNLISNAIKYSPQASNVHLQVARHDSSAVISVRDEGEGISPDEIQNLFQPFQRSSPNRNTIEGTGLGLFSIKKIVEGHKGTIQFFSEPGNGTTVKIIFPVGNDH